MINTVRLRNFKNHRDTEIDLGRLTALVGPNGAGKTSFLEAIHQLTSIAQEGELKEAADLLRSRSQFVRWGAKKLFVAASGTLGNDRWALEISVGTEPASAEDDQAEDDTLVRFEWGGEQFRIKHTNALFFPSVSVQERFQSGIKGARLYRLSSDRMREASKMKAPYGELGVSGGNLASVLSFCMTTEQERYQKIKELVRSLLPSVTGIRTQPDGSDKYELLFDTVSGKGIEAQHISEGTLTALGVATAVTGTNETGGQLIMLDGLERSLHPKAQRDLVNVIRGILKQHENLQIVFTTHSPYIVDELSPEEVYLLNTDDEGIAHARRLSEHPDSERALEVLTTGEFWSAEGEDWVIDQASGDGQPAPSDEATNSDA